MSGTFDRLESFLVVRWHSYSLGCSLLLTLHVVNFSHLDEIARMSLRLLIRLTTFLSQLKELTANGE
jgi:hypothetical protein